jgi:deoxyribose-phosphate aldolase
MKNIKSYTQFIKESISGNFNNIIDYTLLEESATNEDILELCEKANSLGVKSVCVLPKHVKIAAEALKDSKVLVCTVISFPGGTNSIEEKKSETSQVIADGADEVDTVMNYSKLLNSEGDMDIVFDYLVEDVECLVDICHSSNNKDGNEVVLKVIVESGLLSVEETKLVTEVCLKAGADFIKTSTGKSSGPGAELDKVMVMYDTIKDNGSQMMIKASGGIRTMEDINKYKPYVDRFGMGYASVDKINGLTTDNKSSY